MMETIHFLDRAEGVDGVDVSFPERMEVKWGGWRDFRVGKDRPRRVPPLWESGMWFHVD